MKTKLHRVDGTFYITSNEKVLVGDNVLSIKNVDFHVEKKSDILPFDKKIIAFEFQIDVSSLSDEEKKRIDWIDVNQEVHNLYEKVIGKPIDYYNNRIRGEEMRLVKAAFKRAREICSNRFTIEQISKEFVGEGKEGGLFDDFLDYRISTKEQITFSQWYFMFKDKPKTWDVQIELEYIDGYVWYLFQPEIMDTKYFEPLGMRPKLTSNGDVKILKLLC